MPAFRWASDRALLLGFAGADSDQVHARVVGVKAAIEAEGLPGVEDVVGAYASVMVVFEGPDLDAVEIERRVRRCVEGVSGSSALPAPTVTLPCCYEGPFGPDLDEVAALHGMTPSGVIEMHSSATYVVRFVGFSPGFPYLAGLPAALHTARLATPRTVVPAGSVAIAGAQAGVYPQATPGGWRILGRTPVRVFDPLRVPAALLVMGTVVRFQPISAGEFARLSAGTGGSHD
ncbi:MAG: 5-oxoprolinase subunit PxpB [Phycisphaerales bacterium]